MSNNTTQTAHCTCGYGKAKVGRALAFVSPVVIAGILGTGIMINVQASSTPQDDGLCGMSGYVAGLVYQEEACAKPGDGSSELSVTPTMWDPLTKAWLTTEQIQLLNLSYDIGYEDGGIEHAKLVQAVLLQETIAGLISRVGHLSAPVGKRSYGVMQMKVTAARDVLSWNPHFGAFDTDEELIAKLVSDDEFNIRLASAFLKYMRDKTLNDDKALVAYNIGLRASRSVDNAAEFRYVKNVGQYLVEIVEPFNAKFGKVSGSLTQM